MDEDEKIERIFKELGIDGDISFGEPDAAFWKTKLIEVFEKVMIYQDRKIKATDMVATGV